MNDVRPLAFLFVRSVVNGVKRAISSPKRLVTLVFTVGYYWWIFLKPFAPHRRVPVMPRGTPTFDLPPAATIEAVVFGLVGVMSLLLMTSVLGYRGGFKAADVDVLFPTPVSPRVVLLFRIARDTLATLLLPLFVGIIGYSTAAPTLAGFVRNYPKGGGDLLRGFGLAYLLVSFVWVCVGYAASLFVNRSDLQSDRNRKIIGWGIFAIVAALLGYVAVSLRSDFSWATAMRLSQNPFVRVLLAPVTLATWAVMGGFQGKPLIALGGLAGLFGLVALSLRVAMTQVGWMYDQAAVRGVDSNQSLNDLRRKGDTMGMQAQLARQGKLKHGRLARRIAAVRVRGAAALLWKEAILQARGSLSGVVFMGVLLLGVTGMVMWTTAGKGVALSGFSLLAIQGLLVYVLAMSSAQSGFIELLRRVDVQKPLPFTPSVTVFWETLAKAVAPSILGFLCAVVGMAIVPAAWRYALAGILLTPALAILLSAVVLLVVLLFPDVEDPTQRTFRNLMLLFGIVILCTPGLAAFFGLTALLHLSPMLAAPVAAAIDLGIALALSYASGSLYAGYNPSE